MTLLTKRPRIAEIAARAGVSPATVDRVLNGRPGVRGATVERVAAAIRAIADAPPHTPAMSRPDGQIDILLAGDASQVTEELGNALLACATRAGWRAGLSFVERMNPAALAERLHRCADEGSLGVAVQALDHVLVREALERLAECAIPLVTVLTDIAGVNRQA